MVSTLPLPTDDRASGAPGIRGGEPHYQPQLDGIRGLAILAVLLSHSATIIGVFSAKGLGRFLVNFMVPGWGGVDLFFALSGFLITGILLRGCGRKNYFGSFYARRVLRIFPIYYLVLIVTVVLCTQVPALAHSVRGSDARLPATTVQKASFFFYLQNIPVFWASFPGGMVGLWGAYWSLAVEEQFYLLWPALVRFVRVRWLYWFCLGALVGAPLCRQWVASYTGETLGLLHFPITRLDGLFGGAALAFYRHERGKPLPLGWGAVWGGLGIGILFFIAVFHSRELTSPGFFLNRIGISGFALVGVGLITVTQHRVRFFKSVLTFRPLLALGKYSYGIYIYHVAVFLIFERIGWRLIRYFVGPLGVLRASLFCVAAIVISFGVARISYEVIEKRFLVLKHFFPSPGVR